MSIQLIFIKWKIEIVFRWFDFEERKMCEHLLEMNKKVLLNFWLFELLKILTSEFKV